MKLTSKGRTWAAMTFTGLMAGALTIGLLVPAMTSDIRTLDATVADIFDAAEAGDALPSWEHDPDCHKPSGDELEAGRGFLAGWTFTVDNVSVTGNDGYVTATGHGPQGQEDTSITEWRLQADGQWMLKADGRC